ncbi:uncharacterized protein LOC143213022 [Lasioglossum baleicum]|uniref:uncharacterized protein LOC143213022 n=1 Tax=Lasioglossum baleicum TaxID=434251 RepID=UPI003FCCBA84
MMGYIMGCTCFKGTLLSHLFQGKATNKYKNCCSMFSDPGPRTLALEPCEYVENVVNVHNQTRLLVEIGENFRRHKIRHERNRTNSKTFFRMS